MATGNEFVAYHYAGERYVTGPLRPSAPARVLGMPRIEISSRRGAAAQREESVVWYQTGWQPETNS
jgi:hypothetical protein